MDDRELLELAAKAAGVDPTKLKTPYVSQDGLATGWNEWNPLTDDGDALRLAVKLRLDVEWIDPETVLFFQLNTLQTKTPTQQHAEQL